MDVSSGIVVALGIGIVFAGLICIVIICSIMGAVCKMLVKPQAVAPAQQAAPSATSAPIANKQELIAAVCAVIAEELGTEASNIRVTSFKRV